MKTIRNLILLAAMSAVSTLAAADSWKDKGGHARQEFKETYWDGNCKIERKMKKDGEYKEKRKCKGPRHAYHDHPQVIYPVPAPPVVVEPGVTIHGHGTVRFP